MIGERMQGLTILPFQKADSPLVYQTWIRNTGGLLSWIGINILVWILFWKVYFIGVCLIFNIVLISAVTTKRFTYTYIYILFHCGLSQDIEYSSLYYTERWTLFFIHPMYNSLHLLITNSQSIPPILPFLLAITSLFFTFVSLFLFHKKVHCVIF